MIAIVLDNQLSSETLFKAIDPQQCLILRARIPSTEIVDRKPLVTEPEHIVPVMQAVSSTDVSRHIFDLTAK
jgi:hypothetical protein